MPALDGVVRLLKVLAAQRVLMDYGNGKFNLCISCCPFNGWCRYSDCPLMEVLLYSRFVSCHCCCPIIALSTDFGK